MKVIFDEHLPLTLDLITNDMVGWTVHLYQNDRVPEREDTLADFIEATFSGYAPIELGDFDAAAVADHIASAAHPLVTFTHDGGAVANQIYGYYLLDAGGRIRQAERGSVSPLSMNVAGDVIHVKPVETYETKVA